MNWADDDGSSDEESVEPQETTAPSSVPPEQEDVKRGNNEPNEPLSKPVNQGAPQGQSRPRNTKVPDRPPYVAYISNLNYNVTRDMLGDFFHGGGCAVTDVKIMTQKDGQSKGCALVNFRDRESLEKALTAHDAVLEKRPLFVNVSEKNNNMRKPKDYNGDSFRDRRDRDRDRDRAPRNDRDRNRNKQDTRDGSQKDRRGAPPLPSPSSSDAPAVRKKIELKPREKPLETIGERVNNSKIFGEGRARDELNPPTSQVQEMTVKGETNINQANVAKGSDDDVNKKNRDQKSMKDNKKDKADKTDKGSSSRAFKKDTSNGSKKNDKDRKGEQGSRKGSSSKTNDNRKKGKANGDDKEKDADEEVARARFVAANEKLQQSSSKSETSKPKKVVNAFSALDDSDSDESC